MNLRLIRRPSLLLGVFLASGLLVSACAQTPTEQVRIGVYDSRALAVAWAGTESFNAWMGSLQADYTKAKQSGDQQKIAELEAEGQARQQRLHLQAFSTAPVDDILAYLEDSLPKIKEDAGVTMLVSKWDTETLAQYPGAELVDVTLALVDALHPNEAQRQIAIDILEREPIPLEEAEKITDW